MTQPETIEQNSHSGKEVAKQNLTTARAAFSRFSSSFWEERVFRPKYVRDGERVEVPHWYARIQHGGRREAVALNTNSREEAGRKAAKFFKTLCQAGWEAALAELDPERAAAKARSDVPTVGEFLDAAEKGWTGNPRTLRGYGVCLRWFVAGAHEIRPEVVGRKHRRRKVKEWREKVNAVRLDSLTPKAVQAVLIGHVAKAGHNPLAKARAKRSVASLARQARSLFAPGLLKLLPWERIPNPFDGVKVESAKVQPYVSTVDAGRLLRDARTGLSESDPEAFKTILLCLGAGLRREEADNLTWGQLDSTRNVIRVETTATFAPKTQESEGTVPVDPALIGELLRYRDAATGLFVLEGGEPKPGTRFACYRAKDAENRAIAWLRKQGLNVRKPLHCLRKEAGSLVNEAAGIHAASRFLRHSNIATTAAYYADNRSQATVRVGELLSPGKKAQVVS